MRNIVHSALIYRSHSSNTIFAHLREFACSLHIWDAKDPLSPKTCLLILDQHETAKSFRGGLDVLEVVSIDNL